MKHNIGRYGSVSWWCNGTLTVLLCVTVYYGDITAYYCDSADFQAGQNGGGHWPNDSPCWCHHSVTPHIMRNREITVMIQIQS